MPPSQAAESSAEDTLRHPSRVGDQAGRLCKNALTTMNDVEQVYTPLRQCNSLSLNPDHISCGPSGVLHNRFAWWSKNSKVCYHSTYLAGPQAMEQQEDAGQEANPGQKLGVRKTGRKCTVQ